MKKIVRFVVLCLCLYVSYFYGKIRGAELILEKVQYIEKQQLMEHLQQGAWPGTIEWHEIKNR